MSGERGDPGTIEEQIAALLEAAGEEFSADLDEEELLMVVNEYIMKNGEAMTTATCVAQAPFGQGTTKRMLRELTEAGRLTAPSPVPTSTSTRRPPGSG